MNELEAVFDRAIAAAREAVLLGVLEQEVAAHRRARKQLEIERALNAWLLASLEGEA